MMDTIRQRSSRLRTLLILGRVSNLPTVWSNCLAGWLLTGEPLRPSFSLVVGGATCLYTGGMLMNDACDAEFDRRSRSERPIPQGYISKRRVWTLALLLLIVGGGLVSATGTMAATLTMSLVAAIALYDLLHKRWAPSLILMALCRSLLYLVAGAAASSTMDEIVGPSIALGFYVLGISLIARAESRTGKTRRWPLLLLLIPLPTVIYLSVGKVPPLMTMVCSAFLIGFLGDAFLSQKQGGNAPRLVGQMIAGIILVDWLFVTTVESPNWSSLAFPVLLALALLLQRRVPAS